ncbi:hypothetical protein AwWohl_03690 [Gammaproteobacteria bacterium]|nr:hypothetical protein AwWohl_03690 [Gammaproteobacteria bacterium]
MQAYPLAQITLEQAIAKQFKIVDTIAHFFKDNSIFNLGDVGIHPIFKKPKTTHKVEQVYAALFNACACQMIVGSGTQAIRYALMANVAAGSALFVHNAPIYPTTATTINSMNLTAISCDFHDNDNIKSIIIANPKVKVALLQHSRQKMDDKYDLATVIKVFKEHGIKTIVDDNYVVNKVDKIGIELGADVSTFSCFKMLGPEDIGCVIGDHATIDKIKEFNYSGGSQVQGWQAMEALRQIIYTPVAFAIQSSVVDAVCARLSNGEIPEVSEAIISNSQSKNILVKLSSPIAAQVILKSIEFGATNCPVGAESKYEFMPMFYKLSGTFLANDPSLLEYTIRINPMRAGADTVINILKQAIDLAQKDI